MNLVERARREVQAPHAYLREAFGEKHLSVVYAVQRRVDGPVKIGTSTSLPRRAAAFLNACPDPVMFRVVLPGGQPLEHYLHSRHAGRVLFGEWYGPAEVVLSDLAKLAALQVEAFAEHRKITDATLDALRRHDPELRDLEMLLRNGTSYKALGELLGTSARDVRDRCASMRALGFPLGYRQDFAPRAVRASRSPRFDTPTRGARQIG